MEVCFLARSEFCVVGHFYQQVVAVDRDLRDFSVPGLVYHFADRHLCVSFRAEHSVALNHALGQLGSLLQVIAGACCYFLEDYLLGDASTHGDGQPVFKLVLCPQVPIFFRDQRSVAAHLPTGDDGYLVDRIGELEAPGHQSVPCLVVGRHLFFPGVDQPVLALRSGDNTVHRLFEVVHEDLFLVASGGHDGRLIDQVRELCAAEPWCFLGQ